MKHTTLERLKQIMETVFDVDATNLTVLTKLVPDVCVDSLDKIQLVIEMEKEFQIDIPDDQIPTLNTILDLVQLIDKLKQ